MGVLFDSHALDWLVGGEAVLADEALIAIGEAQGEGALLVSPVTAWELALAARKPVHRDPPRLGTGSPQQWFRAAVRAAEARIVPIQARIASEAAAVVEATGHAEPGDRFPIAAARVRLVPIVTRDARMIAMATGDDLAVAECWVRLVVRFSENGSVRVGVYGLA